MSPNGESEVNFYASYKDPNEDVAGDELTGVSDDFKAKFFDSFDGPVPSDQSERDLYNIMHGVPTTESETSSESEELFRTSLSPNDQYKTADVIDPELGLIHPSPSIHYTEYAKASKIQKVDQGCPLCGSKSGKITVKNLTTYEYGKRVADMLGDQGFRGLALFEEFIIF